MPSRRFLLALAASLVLHLVVIGSGLPGGKVSPRDTPASLSARLLPPATVLPQDTLLKDKLADVLFYPPEAVARGLEGEVRLLLTLERDGRVLDAQVAAGSGHKLLDEAAVKAAYAMGSLPDAGAREVILPVVFRLR
jgi:protein TonB